MPSTTLTRSEPVPQTPDGDHDLSDDALRAFDWLARTALWQRRLDQLRGDAA
jgi:hypothetical protein